MKNVKQFKDINAIMLFKWLNDEKCAIEMVE